MLRLNWSDFKLKNENCTKSFEELCYHLFCRKYKLKEGVRADYNQIGLETYPVKDKNNNLIGFQSKFFENKLSDNSSVKQIIDSIKKTKKTYKNLNRIVLYTHKSFGGKNPRYKVKIEKIAKPVKIDWFVESNFKASLSHPSNFDLAQLYFGSTDDIGFIKNSIHSEILTFLQSSIYMDLPIKDKSNNSITNLKQEILKSKRKIFIITGNPGSGKSILMHKLLEYFGALDQKTERKMIDQLISQGGVPVLINLKNCNTDSLENILRGRQNDCNIRSTPLNFIYLFDGLDELSEQNADSVLSYISELKRKTNTQKIIISCRAGNFNKIKAKAYFNDIKELCIAELDFSHIEKYFFSKTDTLKISKLFSFKSSNPDIFKVIKDILMIDLLWETIDRLDEKSIITDLIEMKINMLIDDPKHKKNIEGLNLFNPKKEEIISINQDISFEFQNNFQYRFPQKRLQEIILKKFPRLDYQSVNTIINYLADLFFDIDSSDKDSEQTYVYQHRRYQEFFFAQKLKLLYEENPLILRKLNILSNNDFFENLFLKYLRKTYGQ